MGEGAGVLAAMLSSGIGGASIGVTRFIAQDLDPLAIGAFRFGLGFMLLFPFALSGGRNWPQRGDWSRVAALGLLFFGAFPILFNASLAFTTAARGAIALSTLPLLTMVVAAVFKVEPLTKRKALGVCTAMTGAALALLAGFSEAPAKAWRGDLLMVLAALCMAIYSVASKPLIRRSDPITFTVVAMGVGAFALTLASSGRGSFEPIRALDSGQWAALGFLGAFGGALTFFLWAFALQRTTPTRVAISIAVNPLAAALVGALLVGEVIRWNLSVGIVAVVAGIWIAARPDSAPDCKAAADS
ncbi:DMT family transporter [Pseudorhodoferax soli]|uniref:Drug/metabolite transporter (DMT)-like permease n=1 Tax=Pseudorhodoferax soli TaxID=545864 RepID=A0A368XWN7_9BURK|nr:DMT family transporter [Pseudorhodoferax soli]RCW72401.1 drug/metabolite transporter (DMT)-like permease [Pseudorhodoferax soli]